MCVNFIYTLYIQLNCYFSIERRKKEPEKLISPACTGVGKNATLADENKLKQCRLTDRKA